MKPVCDKELIRVDLHTLVRTLAYEARMIRLCRDGLLYVFWLVLALLCVPQEFSENVQTSSLNLLMQN